MRGRGGDAEVVEECRSAKLVISGFKSVRCLHFYWTGRISKISYFIVSFFPWLPPLRQVIYICLPFISAGKDSPSVNQSVELQRQRAVLVSLYRNPFAVTSWSNL